MHAGETIGIVGLGQMGRGIAQVAASAGYPVWVTDAAPELVEQLVTHQMKLTEQAETENAMLHQAVSEEREACAKAIEALFLHNDHPDWIIKDEVAGQVARECVAAIRRRK